VKQFYFPPHHALASLIPPHASTRAGVGAAREAQDKGMYWVKPKPRPWVSGWWREGLADPEVPEEGKSCGFFLSFFFFRLEKASRSMPNHS